jgi:hypothetical protein
VKQQVFVHASFLIASCYSRLNLRCHPRAFERLGVIDNVASTASSANIKQTKPVVNPTRLISMRLMSLMIP